MPEPFLRGKCAVPGVAEGRVRVVKDQEDVDSFKEGEIFVAFTSTPAMVAAMRKAVAIVTDVGGTKKSTIHPAVVAQELGIPCVVRTRVGSKRLKTGQKVWVDATKGNIYLLDDL